MSSNQNRKQWLQRPSSAGKLTGFAAGVDLWTQDLRGGSAREAGARYQAVELGHGHPLFAIRLRSRDRRLMQILRRREHVEISVAMHPSPRLRARKLRTEVQSHAFKNSGRSQASEITPIGNFS